VASELRRAERVPVGMMDGRQWFVVQSLQRNHLGGLASYVPSPYLIYLKVHESLA
jgi:hypothetical protein